MSTRLIRVTSTVNVVAISGGGCRLTVRSWQWTCTECGRWVNGYLNPGYAADRGRNHLRARHQEAS